MFFNEKRNKLQFKPGCSIGHGPDMTMVRIRIPEQGGPDQDLGTGQSGCVTRRDSMKGAD
jgi:hypothetical protein